MVRFRKKRETRLIFRDKTVRLLSGGNVDEQTGQITLKTAELGFLKHKDELTLPFSALEFDVVSLLTSNQIRVDVPNYYASGQVVPIAERKEMMLRERLIQRETELKFANKQLNSANQALNSASATPEDMLDKKVQQLQSLVNVVAPIMRMGGKSKAQAPATFLMPPEYPTQFPIGEQNE